MIWKMSLWLLRKPILHIWQLWLLTHCLVQIPTWKNGRTGTLTLVLWICQIVQQKPLKEMTDSMQYSCASWQGLFKEKRCPIGCQERRSPVGASFHSSHPSSYKFSHPGCASTITPIFLGSPKSLNQMSICNPCHSSVGCAFPLKKDQ